jgi:predicted metal-dependent phosphoesterase TrpH
VRIDLHTHSTASDGTDSPAELMLRARDAELDVVALCDHDSAAGWDEADVAAHEAGIVLIPGIEISTTFRGAGVHLLAYFVDPSEPALAAELDRILDGRRGRLAAVVRKLNEHGIELTEDDVHFQVGDAAAIGRPHIADALVANGVVASRQEAFEKYLSAGLPGHVVRYATPLVEMLGLVAGASGVPVIAHPWGRASRDVLTADAIASLSEAGLVGLEIDHHDHDGADRAALREIADHLGFVVTGSSDYHGVGKVSHDLGSNLTDPDQLERLVDLADERHGTVAW